MTETMNDGRKRAKGPKARGAGVPDEGSDSLIPSTSSAKPAIRERVERRVEREQEEVEGMREPAETDTFDGEAKPPETSSFRDTVLQRCMRLSSFRSLVISRLIKKLR